MLLMEQKPFFMEPWPLHGVVWPFMAKYRFGWTCIVFSRGHRSKLIWSCLTIWFEFDAAKICKINHHDLNLIWILSLDKQLYIVSLLYGTLNATAVAQNLQKWKAAKIENGLLFARSWIKTDIEKQIRINSVLTLGLF